MQYNIHIILQLTFTLCITLLILLCFYKIPFKIYNFEFPLLNGYPIIPTTNPLTALCCFQSFAKVNNVKNIFKQIMFFTSGMKVFNIKDFHSYTFKESNSHTITSTTYINKTSHYTHCPQICLRCISCRDLKRLA